MNTRILKFYGIVVAAVGLSYMTYALYLNYKRKKIDSTPTTLQDALGIIAKKS